MVKCKNCGKENSEEAKFCEKCGANLTVKKNAEQISEHKNRKKIFVLFSMIIIILAIALAGFVAISVQNEKKYQDSVAAGDKYLEQESYEQAIDSFTAAIDIDPKQIKPYRGLAKTYIAMDESEEAETIYNTAIDMVKEEYNQKQIIIDDGIDLYKDAITYYGENGDTEKVDELAEEIIELLEDENTREEFVDLQDYYNRYWSYYNKLMELQEIYGEAQVIYDNNEQYMNGLCFAKLIDFDADGFEELLVVYGHETFEGSGYGIYEKEVWEYRDSVCQKIFSGNYQDFISECVIVNVDGKNYIAEGDFRNRLYGDFWGYQGETFQKVKSLGHVNYSEEYQIDGEKVSQEEYESEAEKWWANLEKYDLLKYNYDEYESDLNKTLSELNNTTKELRKKLGIAEK